LKAKPYDRAFSYVLSVVILKTKLQQNRTLVISTLFLKLGGCERHFIFMKGVPGSKKWGPAFQGNGKVFRKLVGLHIKFDTRRKIAKNLMDERVPNFFYK